MRRKFGPRIGFVNWTWYDLLIIELKVSHETTRHERLVYETYEQRIEYCGMRNGCWRALVEFWTHHGCVYNPEMGSWEKETVNA